jgi:ribonuclease BN (tRNA processing enzyme)
MEEKGIMKLKVIGKLGRFPTAESGTSCFLISECGDNILLDMGNSSLMGLQKHISINELNAVVLTHLHGDHIADFQSFTYMTSIMKAEGRLKNNITVYLPETPANVYGMISGASGIDYKVIKDGIKANIGALTLEFYSMVHPIETYGVRVTANGKVIAYTSDSRLTPNLTPLIKNADIAIGDACILDSRHTERSPHLSVKQLGHTAREAGVKKLLLAHLPDIEQEEILKEARAEFMEAYLADDSVTYEV